MRCSNELLMQAELVCFYRHPRLESNTFFDWKNFFNQGFRSIYIYIYIHACMCICGGALAAYLGEESNTQWQTEKRAGRYEHGVDPNLPTNVCAYSINSVRQCVVMQLYIYIYIYIYRCVHIHTHTHVCICI